MAIAKEANKEALPLSEGFIDSKDNDLQNYTSIDSIFSSFRPERRARAERQIAIFLKKMELHPQFKEHCISSIKELIKYEIMVAQKRYNRKGRGD